MAYMEDWLHKLPSLGKELMKCPVCKSRLGFRVGRNTIFTEHCDDCKATYTFNPGADVPTSSLDCKKGKACDCGRCN